jgi:2-hydroxychromene-2-carboxylate isomerase
VKPFVLTYDYRCPFARNAHEHVAVALADGAGWEVTFVPFSLSQVHVPEGGAPVWEDPDKASDLLALSAGLVVRDQYPDRFLEAHIGLFGARHDERRDLREAAVVADVLDRAGVPGDKVVAEVESGSVMDALRQAHEDAVREWGVFGVPTFVVGDRAVFVRLTTRPDGDAASARLTIEGVVELFDEHPELHEFKTTTISH